MSDAYIVRRGGGGTGGLNFKIVGGTTRPGNPKENTIWVNTDIKIGKWTVSPTRPTSAIHGDVWVQSKNTGELVDVLEKNSLIIGIVGIEQYVTDAWSIVPGGFFANNAWTEFTIDYPIFIPDGGAKAEFVSWTGEWCVVTNDGNVLSVSHNNSYGYYTEFVISTSQTLILLSLFWRLLVKVSLTINTSDLQRQ